MLNPNNRFFIEKDNFSRLAVEAIRDIRIECGLSQEELGGLSGYDRTYIGAIERGEKNVSFYAIYKILTALETDPAEFFKKI